MLLHKEVYEPEDEVKLKFSVRDETGEPCAATLSMAVIDDRNLTFANDKQAHLMSHLLLNSELEGKIEEPSAYFDLDEKSEHALDLLMLTHGWKRYHWEAVRATSLDNKASLIPQLKPTGSGQVRATGEVIPNAKVTLSMTMIGRRVLLLPMRMDDSLSTPASGIINLYIERRGLASKEIDVQLDKATFERLNSFQVPNRNWYWYGYRNSSSQVRLLNPTLN